MARISNGWICKSFQDIPSIFGPKVHIRELSENKVVPNNSIDVFISAPMCFHLNFYHTSSRPGVPHMFWAHLQSWVENHCKTRASKQKTPDFWHMLECTFLTYSEGNQREQICSMIDYVDSERRPNRSIDKSARKVSFVFDLLNDFLTWPGLTRCKPQSRCPLQTFAAVEWHLLHHR